MGWIIFGCIIGLFAGLLSLSVVFTVRYSEEFLVWVGVGPFRYGLLVTEEEQALREEKKTQKKKKKRKKTASPQKKSGNHRKKKPSQPKKKPEKGNIKETVGVTLDLIRAITGPLPFLLRHFRVTGLKAWIVVGGDDAAEIALNYGKLSGVVHGSLAALRNLIPVRVKRIDLFCDFCSSETRQQIDFKVKIRIGILLWTALRMGGRFLVYTYNRAVPSGTAAAKKTADRQKAAGSHRN